MKKLYLLFLTLLCCALPGLAQEMYLVGDMTGGVEQAEYKFTKSGETYTLSGIDLTGSFKIWYKNGGKTYKLGGGSNLPLNSPIKINTMNSSTMAEDPLTGATITVTIGSNNNSGTMTVTKEVAIETLYVYGTVTGNSMIANENTKMTNQGNGIFVISNVALTTDEESFEDEYAHFIFTNDDDLTTTYGSPESNYLVELYKPALLKKGGDDFAIAPGTYDIRINLNKNTVEVDPVLNTMSIVGTLGINGTIGSLSSNAGISMTKGENGVFTANNVIIGGAGNTGVGSFFFVEKTGANWDNVGVQFGPKSNNLNVTPGTAAALTVTTTQPVYNVAQGIYNVTLDTKAMTVTLTKVDVSILEMTVLGDNYVNSNPGDVSQFVIRVGNDLYGNATITPGMTATLTKVSAEHPNVIEMSTVNRRLFFNPETGYFIGVPKQLNIIGADDQTAAMTYKADGTYEGTVPFFSKMVLGGSVNETTYGSDGIKVTATSEPGVYQLYTGSKNWITDMTPFENKKVVFNPLTLTLAVTGDGNLTPTFETMYLIQGENAAQMTGAEGVFSTTVKLAKGDKFNLCANNTVTGLGVVPTAGGSVAAGTSVLVSYTGQVSAGNAFTFTGTTGYYNVTVNTKTNQLEISEYNPTLESLNFIAGGNTTPMTKSGNVFTANVELAKGVSFRLGSDDNNGVIPSGISNVSVGGSVAIAYTNDVNNAPAFTFSGTPGIYTLEVNLDVMAVTLKDNSDVNVATLAEMAENQGGYFTGTATCEFNYQNDEGVYEMWMKEGDTALKFTMSAAQVNENVMKVMGPTDFNRGNTFTKFRAVYLNGVYVITEVTTSIFESDGQSILAPYIGKAEKQDIPEVIDLDAKDVNTLVQVKGKIYTNVDDMYVDVNGTHISILNTFTRPIDNPELNSAPMMAEGSSSDWLYGSSMPTYSGSEGYVAGIVTEHNGGLALAATAMSEGGPITKAELTEIDAETIVDVYNMQGMRVRRAVKYGEVIRELPAGIYIIGGKKIAIR